MKKLVILFLFAIIPIVTLAAEGEPKLDHVNIDLNDKPSLQRGARIFVNYCLSCHSASYMRYNRMGQDLKLSESELASSLMLTSVKETTGIVRSSTLTGPRASLASTTHAITRGSMLRPTTMATACRTVSSLRMVSAHSTTFAPAGTCWPIGGSPMLSSDGCG